MIDVHRSNTPEIPVHRSFQDGNVQFIHLTNTDNENIGNGQKQMCAGVAQPGEYDFGEAKIRTSIEVTFGLLTDQKRNKFLKGYTMVFKEGDKISFICQKSTIFICRFG